MRKVYLGKFEDSRVDRIGDNGGFDFAPVHVARREEERDLRRTRGLEYYVKDMVNQNIMIKDATVMEKIFARIRYIFKFDKKRIVGYRDTKPYKKTDSILRKEEPKEAVKEVSEKSSQIYVSGNEQLNPKTESRKRTTKERIHKKSDEEFEI